MIKKEEAENARKKLVEKYGEEGIKNILALGEVLRKIHNRLLSEGYTYEKGKGFTAPKEKK
jgi:hypothetical protein